MSTSFEFTKIDGNPDADGIASITGATGAIGPIDTGGRTRGRTVYTRNDGTAYSDITLQGRVDPTDDSGWITAIDMQGNGIHPTAGDQSLSVLGADYAQLLWFVNGGDGASVLVTALGREQ